MLTGNTPYRDIPKTAILGQLMSPRHELRLEFPGDVPSYLHSLIRELTQPDPPNRLESAQAREATGRPLVSLGSPGIR
jgi:hypothetical protein